MNFLFDLLDPSTKYIAQTSPVPCLSPDQPIYVMKNEEFGLQLIVRGEDEFTIVRGQSTDICWKGLGDQIRIHLTAEGYSSVGEMEPICVSDLFCLYLMDFVSDDEGNRILDILTNKDSIFSTLKDQGVFITGKLPKNFSQDRIRLNLCAFHSNGYEEEVLIYEHSLDIYIHDYTLGDICDSDFYMDLWQHPCNWARAYDLPYYSPAHMDIIDHYLEGMAQLGQRVCDLIVSDYPWAGQRCYQVADNHQNLFELNMVRVFKQVDGRIVCDFTALDQYIDLAHKHGISQEINLFGILGNWDAKDFGNPLVDFADPIRIRYLDLARGTYRYFTSRTELSAYLQLVFSHLAERGLWEKTLIISDEPSNISLFKESVKLFEEAAQGKPVRLKCAIHDQNFFESYGEHIRSLSLNTCELVNNIDSLEKLTQSIKSKEGTLTWYSCCFPNAMNIFLKSPFLESRLIGWFTYYMGLDGFLRWAYGIWPGNVYQSASYKKEKWAAGDMFFVYPGKDGYPLASLRLKNLLYGIQDYVFLKEMAERLDPVVLSECLEKLLGNKAAMTFIPPREISLTHQLDHRPYDLCKQKLLSDTTPFTNALLRISDAVVEMDEDHIIALIQTALEDGIPPKAIYDKGLSHGMLRVTTLFEKKEYFVSEVIVCADTLNKGIQYLKNNFPISSSDGPKVVIAVVEGDLHEIGKNIVKIMFEAAGFQVIDLGLNVKAEDIVRIALEEQAQIIGLSTMMTTTMGKMKDVVDLLATINHQTYPKVIIGGGCISPQYSREIGAHGYSANAVEAVKLVQQLAGGIHEQ